MNAWRRRVFGALLRAYPRDFRDDYAGSMADHLEADEQRENAFSQTMFDVVRSSLTMRAENLWRDLVYAVRMNAKAPLFTIVILGTIALAIATNAIAFALLNAVLLKPLPFTGAAHLGVLSMRSAANNGMTFSTLTNSQADTVGAASKDLRALTYAMSPETVSLGDGATVRRVQAKTNYFSTLGIRPVLGTFLTDGPPARQAVISSALWHARYGGSVAVLGRRIALDQIAYTIVGVAPAGMLDPSFGGLQRDDVWTKFPRLGGGSDAQVPVFPIVRLRANVSWVAVQADLDRIQHTLKGLNGLPPDGALSVAPLTDSIFSFARSFLWLAFAALTGVLLIACANVANLLLARGAVREPEFAVRCALGASTRRIGSQVLTETLLLAVVGGAAGLAGAWFTLPFARAGVPGQIPRVQTAHIDLPVLLYVLALVIAVTLLTGVLPAYRRARLGRRDATVRLRPALVVAEIAIAFALTAGFGVMLHSFVSMTGVPLGFDAHNVYVAILRPNRDALFSVQFAPGHTQPIAASEIERRARAIPGVQAASVTTGAPFDNSFMMQIMLPSGWNGRKGGQPLVVGAMQVGASYFRLLGIPLIAGAEFVPADFTKPTGNVIVNQAFVRAYFPHENVIGKSIRNTRISWHVIAVAADTRTSFREKPRPMMYFPFNGGFGPYFGVIVRTAHPMPALAKDVTAALKSASPMPSTVAVSSLDDLVAQDASGMRTSLDLLGALALVALVLGLCGIYSVVAYGTQRRYHEIGIRMAVGAQPQQIVGLILRGSVVQCVIGIAAGLLLCVFTMPLLASQLYKTSPLDAPSLAAVACAMLLCAVVAALVPACRAAFARPSTTLRYE